MSNSWVVSFAQQRSGCGKSTLAVNTAVAAQQVGLRVCIYDADPQGSATDWAQQRLATGRPEVVVYGVDKGPLSDLPELRDCEYDLIVADTPGSDGESMGACIQASDVVYIPFKSSMISKLRIDSVVEHLKSYPEVRGHLLLNRVKPEKIQSRELQDALAQLLKNESVMERCSLLDLFLCRRGVYKDSLMSGESVMEISPDGKAADEIRQLLENILLGVAPIQAAAKPNSSNAKAAGLNFTPDVETSEMLDLLYKSSLLGMKSKREFARQALAKAVKERMKYVREKGWL